MQHSTLFSLLAALWCAACSGDRAAQEAALQADAGGSAAPRKQLSTETGGATRWSTFSGCKLNCDEQVSAVDGPAATKSAFCESSCSCFADSQIDADGKVKRMRREAVQRAHAACQYQTSERLGWSPAPQAQAATTDTRPKSGPDVAAAPPREVADRKTGESMCNQGCGASVAAAAGTQEIKRAYCQKNCACLADAAFDAQGKARPLKAPFASVAEACMKKTVAALRWSPNPADL